MDNLISNKFLFNNVLDELLFTVDEYGTNICFECGNFIKEEDLIESTCFNYNGTYCSGYCRWSFEYDLKKDWKKSKRLKNRQ
jgi:hypothetical protein